MRKQHSKAEARNEHLATRSRRFSEAWDEFVESVELSELGVDPDEIFGSVRDRRPELPHTLR
jgi:hypothetical protein